MDPTALHLEIRNSLSLADELSRHEHVLGNDDLAGELSALRTALANLERDVGRSHAVAHHPDPETVAAIEQVLRTLDSLRERVPRPLRARTRELLASAERVSFALRDPAARVPSKPLFGVLPVARVVPQDLCSMVEYVTAAGFFASARLARTKRARVVGAILGAGIGGTSLVTDYRLSAAKLLPIEMHEALGGSMGLGAIVAPFALGYLKRDPLAALLHIGLGLGTMAAVLFTDHRASKGITWPTRSKGGPRVGPPVGAHGVRVPEAQRPLEGLSSARTGAQAWPSG